MPHTCHHLHYSLPGSSARFAGAETNVEDLREGGFTLIELLVVVAILGVVGAVAILNIGVFIGAGSEEVVLAEQHNVQTAVLAYLADGNSIESEFMVCPGSKGPLAPYLIGDLTQCWVIGLNGAIGSGGLSTLFSSDFDDMAGLLSLMGDWYVEDGVLKPTLTGGEHRIAVVEGGPWQDFMLSVTAQYLSGDYAGGGYGIYYRADGEAAITGYVLQFDPGLGNDFVVRKVVNGHEQSAFQRVDMASVLGQDWVDNHLNDAHDIQIQVRGDQHVITVDGTEILNFTDDTFSEGTVGFRSWHSTDVGFDDIEVTA